MLGIVEAHHTGNPTAFGSTVVFLTMLVQVGSGHDSSGQQSRQLIAVRRGFVLIWNLRCRQGCKLTAADLGEEPRRGTSQQTSHHGAFGRTSTTMPLLLDRCENGKG